MLTSDDLVLRDLETGDAGWIIARHAELYRAEAGFDPTFEALVAELMARFIRGRDPLRERAFIAVRGGQRIGSLLLTRETDDRAKIRLFLVEPEARGQGIGRRMLLAALAEARARGYRSLGFWTFDTPRAAQALYLSAGFRLVTSHPAHSFGHDVVEQEWETAL